MNKKWITITSRVAYENSYFCVKEDRVVLPSGQYAHFAFVSRSPAVMIAPLLRNDRLVLVRQFRYIVDGFSWEFPAGSIGATEEPIDAAKRELEEEAGYISHRVQLLNSVHTSNGTTDEIVHLFGATCLVPSTQKLDITEQDMVAGDFSIADCSYMISSGEISCSATILTFLLLQAAIKSGQFGTS